MQGQPATIGSGSSDGDGSNLILPAVDIERISKSFGSFRALDDVSLRVRAGERVVICGPSGSGKSTLIRCVNGLESHEDGRIVVNGIELSDNPKALTLVRKQVGMVFQQFNLFAHLTVLEDLSLGTIRAA